MDLGIRLKQLLAEEGYSEEEYIEEESWIFSKIITVLYKIILSILGILFLGILGAKGDRTRNRNSR
jgi:hypothetical protein